MKISRLFLYSAGGIFLLTATAKLVSSFGHDAILQIHEPFIGLQFNKLLQLTGFIEFIIGLACFFPWQFVMRMGLVAWLSSIILLYRLGLTLIGWHKPCSCLGNLTDALHIPPQIADITMKLILAYLLIGSYTSLLWLWQQGKNASPLPQEQNNAG